MLFEVVISMTRRTNSAVQDKRIEKGSGVTEYWSVEHGVSRLPSLHYPVIPHGIRSPKANDLERPRRLSKNPNTFTKADELKLKSREMIAFKIE